MDRGVIASANELFDARHYPGVIAMVSDALDHEPDCVPLLVLRARAHIALRRDLDAQADLRDIIRLDPQCSLAYRLLGELAARRSENESAAIFFREAIRLNAHDREAHEWLAIAEAASVRNAAASGRPLPRARTAPPQVYMRPGSQPRLARGTQPPEQDDNDDELAIEKPTARTAEEQRRTQDRFGRRGSDPNHDVAHARADADLAAPRARRAAAGPAALRAPPRRSP